MNTLLVGLFAAALLPAALAQPTVGAERSRLAEERRAAESAFTAQEKACYRRFAVNDCLQDARSQRRDALAVVRRQEVALNDAERRRKATERLQELDERAASRAAAERNPAAAPAPSAAPAVEGRSRAGSASPPSVPPTPPPAAPAAAAPAAAAPAVTTAPGAAAGSVGVPASGQPARADPARSAPPPNSVPTAPRKAGAEARQPVAGGVERRAKRLEEAQARKERAAQKAAGKTDRAKPLPVP